MKLPKRITKELDVVLSDREVLLRGKMLAESRVEFRKIKDEAKSVAKEYKDDLEAIEDEMRKLDVAVTSGSEPRPVECEWAALYEVGTKQLTRLDTGEVVSAEPLSDEERQVEMQPTKGEE
jgi:hypothetical protein